jgi:hypothetical protein
MKMFAKSFDSQSVSGFGGMQETSAATLKHDGLMKIFEMRRMARMSRKGYAKSPAPCQKPDA